MYFVVCHIMPAAKTGVYQDMPFSINFIFRMELKVSVDGIQRVICGVTEMTTCQEVVIALAQALGKLTHCTVDCLNITQKLSLMPKGNYITELI